MVMIYDHVHPCGGAWRVQVLSVLAMVLSATGPP
jgi:hypothetical protein